MKAIKKTIEIKAAPEKVWDVLFNDNYNRIWYKAFGPEISADTDWEPGSKAIFADKEKNGLIAKVAEKKMNQYMSLHFTGVIENGIERYTGKDVDDLKTGKENYTLSGKDGKTVLDISADMDESYFDPMSDAWDMALAEIKSLSERNN